MTFPDDGKLFYKPILDLNKPMDVPWIFPLIKPLNVTCVYDLPLYPHFIHGIGWGMMRMMVCTFQGACGHSKKGRPLYPIGSPSYLQSAPFEWSPPTDIIFDKCILSFFRCIRIYLTYTISYLVGDLEHSLCFHILGIIIPIDFHIFQRGFNPQPDIISHFIWQK